MKHNLQNPALMSTNSEDINDPKDNNYIVLDSLIFKLNSSESAIILKNLIINNITMIECICE